MIPVQNLAQLRRNLKKIRRTRRIAECEKSEHGFWVENLLKVCVLLGLPVVFCLANHLPIRTMNFLCFEL
jgi:hypothetical protein